MEDRVLVHGVLSLGHRFRALSLWRTWRCARKRNAKIRERETGDRGRAEAPGRAIVNTADNVPLFDTNTNDPRYGTIIDKPIQRRRKIGEIEQNGCSPWAFETSVSGPLVMIARFPTLMMGNDGLWARRRVWFIRPYLFVDTYFKLFRV